MGPAVTRCRMDVVSAGRIAGKARIIREEISCLEEMEQDRWEEDPERVVAWVAEAAWEWDKARVAVAWADSDLAPGAIVYVQAAERQCLISVARHVIRSSARTVAGP